MPVFRIYVEKKPGYDVEAGSLQHEFSHIFGIKTLTGLRLLNRYDIEGLDEAYLDTAIHTILSEPRIDNTFESLPEKYDSIIAVESLPGQFDQRADSCAQCLQMLTCGERPIVRTARIFLLYGKLTDGDLQAIEKHLINPVESMKASLETPETLMRQYTAPAAIPAIEGFTGFSDAELSNACAIYELAMDADDLAFCQEYFRSEGRDPTLTELRVIDTYWSDHCRHTTFLTHLGEIVIEDESVKSSFEKYLEYKEALSREDLPITLMDLATCAVRVLKRSKKLTALDESDEINACSVKIKVDVDGKEQDWLLMFKNETHNHPTEIEPFGGAATCIGGAIRDPLSGRSYVYHAMRITGSGDPTAPVSETLTGKLPQRSITTKAAKGFSSYGNQIGIATGLVREIYHPGYIAKRMEVGAVIGAAPKRNVIRKKPEPGDKVILLGGRTGRDGCGGATGSSKSHSKESLTECGAEVQKGNAPEERKIQRLFRNPKVTRLIKRCNDFGAGGVAVAVGELADGLIINLNTVPKKYSGLDGTELAISESQERMAVVVGLSDADAFIAFANEENLEATVIAEITQSPRLVMEWNGKKIVNISREFLNTNGKVKRANVFVGKLPAIHIFTKRARSLITIHNCTLPPLNQFFALLVSDLNVCSQKGLAEQFDSTIGAGTVIMPFGGIYQMTPSQAMAAKLPVQAAVTNTCSLMSYAFYPDASQKNPYAAAYLAVAASVSKIVAAGGSLSRCWLSFQEYFQRLGDDPEKWGKPFSALVGAFQAQIDIGVAAIGGKDSMSGSFENLDVPPTLISFAVSTAQAGNIISGEFKEAGSDVVLLAPRYRSDSIPVGGSLRDLYATTERLICEKKVLAAYVVEAGGVGEALFKMTLGNRIGFMFDKQFADTSVLASHYIGSIVLELSEPYCDTSAASEDSLVLLGKTIQGYQIKMGKSTVDCSKLQELYENRLEPVFATRTPILEEPLLTFTYKGAGSARTGQTGSETAMPRFPSVITGKPRVLIPVFPGTNCEYDMEKAFLLAGASTEILVIRNLSPADIEQSVHALSEAIRRSQILALPGGFSGGDEPDGSGKFIVSLFRNPRIVDAIDCLLKEHDGLMCGICNGFQALIKLGLVPYGEIREPSARAPTLTFNTIGRHQSMLVRTRVASNKSPWLSNTNLGDIHTVAISHGEGRFVADRPLIMRLAENGQIATQYVDLEGKPSMDVRFNPNGSVCAIEGITSPDGRIFGKMGHNERAGDGLYVNVPGNTVQGIFAAAVNYFI